MTINTTTLTYRGIVAPTPHAADLLVERLRLIGVDFEQQVRTFVTYTTDRYFDRARGWSGGNPVTIVAVAHEARAWPAIVTVVEQGECEVQTNRSDTLAAAAAFVDLDAIDFPPYDGAMCNTYWGSHGCDRHPEHPLPHVCGRPGDDEDGGVCSVHDSVGVRYMHIDDELSERYPSTTFR